MKKALVVFLALALAGGLFAAPTFTGSLSTGIGIGLTDDSDAKAQIDYIRNRGDNGIQADLGVNAAGSKEGYGSYGADITVRASLARFPANADWNNNNAWAISGGKLWWTPNDFLRVDIGDGGPGGMGTMGGFDRSQDVLGGQGLKVKITPITGLTLGVNAFYGRAVKTPDTMKYGFGAKYAVANVLTAVANVTYDLAQTVDAKKFNFAAGVDLGALSALKAIGFTKIAVDFVSDNGLGANNSDIGIGEAINFATGALSLSFGARQLIFTGTDAAPGYIPMRFQLGATYKVSDIVSVGAEGRFLLGNVPSLNFRNAGEINDAAFGGKDSKGVGVSPYVQFNVGPTIQVGYNLQMNMSDPTPATGKKASHLIYATVNVGF